VPTSTNLSVIGRCRCTTHQTSQMASRTWPSSQQDRSMSSAPWTPTRTLHTTAVVDETAVVLGTDACSAHEPGIDRLSPLRTLWSVLSTCSPQDPVPQRLLDDSQFGRIWRPRRGLGYRTPSYWTGSIPPRTQVSTDLGSLQRTAHSHEPSLHGSGGGPDLSVDNQSGG
jgi:hypothetical protein